MDTGQNRTYLHLMANRLILTLLALLTGLAAPVSASQARAAQVASLQVVLGESVCSKEPRAPVALARLPEPGRLNTRRHAPQRIVEPAPIAVRTVMTGIDCALE